MHRLQLDPGQDGAGQPERGPVRAAEKVAHRPNVRLSRRDHLRRGAGRGRDGPRPVHGGVCSRSGHAAVAGHHPRCGLRGAAAAQGREGTDGPVPHPTARRQQGLYGDPRGGGGQRGRRQVHASGRADLRGAGQWTGPLAPKAVSPQARDGERPDEFRGQRHPRIRQHRPGGQQAGPRHPRLGQDLRELGQGDYVHRPGGARALLEDDRLWNDGPRPRLWDANGKRLASCPLSLAVADRVNVPPPPFRSAPTLELWA